MITKFNYVHIGNPDGSFHKIINDCIELSKEYSCGIEWEFNNIYLLAQPDDTENTIRKQYISQIEFLNSLMDN